tara:strand:- start:1914 stop:2261 length:348 start_codon:yes stop_codon:yes gene_type:complete
LKRLIRQFPREQEAIEAIEAFLDEVERHPNLVFTPERFLNKFSLSPSRETAQFLAALENLGVVHKIFRVESRAGGGIKDFDSIVEIPEIIHDFRTDTDVRVEPGDLTILYSLRSG